MSSLGRLKCSIQRVTAVKLVESLGEEGSLHLFTGAGSKVHLQQLISGEWVSLYHQVVLKGAVIYGFRIGEQKNIAVFGQKAVVICQLDPDHGLRVVAPLRRLDDWIRDLRWFDTDRQQAAQYAVITAHNRVLCCSLTGEVIGCYLSDINCILYSAKLLPLASGCHAKDAGELAVVAGTVFNTVILWSTDSPSCRSPVLHSLSGHKGVIFDIDVHLDNQLMCSVSDDRSIHLWHWEYDSGKEKTWSNSKFDLVSVLNGHTCRVWSAVVLDSRYIISIGEDGFVMVWDEHGLIRRRIRSHSSGSVWSISVGRHHMVTTGANGSVWVSHLDSLLEDGVEKILPPNPVSLDDQVDFPRVVCVQADCCYVLTDRGYLYGYNLSKLSTEVLSDDARWSLIATADASDGLTLIALGNTSGLIRLLLADDFFVVQDLAEFQTSKDKLLKLEWVRSTHHLLASSRNGTVLKYEVGRPHTRKIAVSESGCYTLPKQKQWFPACSCQMTGEAGAHYLVLADMDGSIHLYKVEEVGSNLAQPPQASLYRVHGKKGLTDMYSQGDILHSIGRDGYYRKYSLSSEKLIMLDSVKISTEFTWLARFILEEEDSSLKLVAFHTTEIILYDVSLNYAILRVDCGGGHRSWGFTQYSQAFYVVFIKAKSVQIFKKSCSASFIELTPTFHTGKVTCSHLISGDAKAVLITGGDDGCVMASTIDGSNLTSSSRQTYHLYSHISSIKCMGCVWSASQPDTLLVFTGGGRAQLVAAKLRIRTEAKPQTLGMCSTYLSRAQSKKEKVSMDTRIMAITSVTIDTHSHLLLLACSDGSLKPACYSEETECLSVGRAKLYEHSHCLLSVSSCSLANDLLLLAVGATDGTITLLELSPDHIQSRSLTSVLLHSVKASPLARHILSTQSHQSGVNVLTLNCPLSNKVNLYSGGDDNSLVISEVDTCEGKVLSQQVYSEQHTAQITGIILHGDRLLTCSVDQRLHMWSTAGLSGWHLCGSKLTDIADVACMTSHRGLVAVCGEGIEVLQDL